MVGDDEMRFRPVGKSFALLFLCLLFYLGECSSQKPAVTGTVVAKPAICPAEKVMVTPDRVAGPEIMIGSKAEVKFIAQALDHSGQPVPAEVAWQFKDTAADDLGVETGRGHTLSPVGPEAAVFRAAGLAAGDFWVEANLPNCVNADSIPVQGLAKVTVAPNPDHPAQCGRLRVRYGSRDLANETVLGFITFNFWAEIYTRPDLQKDLQVRFFLNDRPIKPRRRLYRPLNDTPALGAPAHFRARLPIFLERGSFRAGYELLQGDQALCASEEVTFATR